MLRKPSVIKVKIVVTVSINRQVYLPLFNLLSKRINETKSILTKAQILPLALIIIMKSLEEGIAERVLF